LPKHVKLVLVTLLIVVTSNISKQKKIFVFSN
jgi:hypothetical protein